MDSSAHRTNPFSESDEAFFEAGVESEREAASERPVVLDSSVVPEGDAITIGAPSHRPRRGARQARLQRTVTSTLAGLSLLALVGLARYALRPGVDAFEQPMPVAAGATAAAISMQSEPDEAAPIEVAASLLAASDDEAVSSGEAPACASLVDDTTALVATETTVPVATETTVPVATEPSPPKVAKHAPVRHGAAPAHRRATTPTIGKAALLRAIRAS